MSETKEKIEVTKKAKLAILAGFEAKKNGREVPKDSIFYLLLVECCEIDNVS